jgi:hypothetical protein
MSRRKSNISQLRCAGWKKSLEFDTTQGQDTSTNVNGVGHSFDGEPGMPLLWCLGYLLVQPEAPLQGTGCLRDCDGKRPYLCGVQSFATIHCSIQLGTCRAVGVLVSLASYVERKMR